TSCVRTPVASAAATIEIVAQCNLRMVFSLLYALAGTDSPGMRRMGFVDRIAAPPIEGVVERKPGFKLCEIVGVHSRQPERCRQQAGSLWREFQMTGIGAPDHRGQTQQRLGRQAEFLDHEIERAPVAAMTPKDAFKIERLGAESLGYPRNLRGSNEQEHRARV